jgi:nicotinate phosphoribosyltransferase
VALARRLGDEFRISAVRLDSGDLVQLSREARRILDEGGLRHVRIFASGGLDEDEIARLVGAGAPIDAFGVGTDMGVSRDVPALDIIYKLVEYAGEDRLKLSPGKAILPGRKQIFRVERDGIAHHDVLARHDERGPGRPLLREVMRAGARRPASRVSLDEARAHARRELDCLPAALRALAPSPEPYEVRISAALAAARDRLRRTHGV